MSWDLSFSKSWDKPPSACLKGSIYCTGCYPISSNKRKFPLLIHIKDCATYMCAHYSNLFLCWVIRTFITTNPFPEKSLLLTVQLSVKSLIYPFFLSFFFVVFVFNFWSLLNYDFYHPKRSGSNSMKYLTRLPRNNLRYSPYFVAWLFFLLSVQVQQTYPDLFSRQCS